MRTVQVAHLQLEIGLPVGHIGTLGIAAGVVVRSSGEPF
jgi:hypothetical protein